MATRASSKPTDSNESPDEATLQIYSRARDQLIAKSVKPTKEGLNTRIPSALKARFTSYVRKTGFKDTDVAEAAIETFLDMMEYLESTDKGRR